MERLRQEDAEEHEWNGKSYNKYEALQEQRHMERQMRKYRRDAELLEQGGADDELIENKRIKYQTKFSQYKAFSKTMGLPMQRDRIYNDGLQVKADPKKVVILRERDIIKDIENTGIVGQVYFKQPIDINYDEILFDDEHINKDRNHNVTFDEAKSFMLNAVVYLKKWQGEYINFYSQEGAVYFNTKNNSIRTAFKASDYKGDVKKMIEVLKKWQIIQF